MLANTLPMESVVLVAPEKVPSLFRSDQVPLPAGSRCHCKVGVGVPLAATMDWALLPAVTELLDGWLVMLGMTALPTNEMFSVMAPVSPGKPYIEPLS